MRPDRRSLLRVLGVRDEGLGPPAAGAGHRRDAIHQCVVLNRWFFVAFFGTAAGCGLLIVTSLWTWPEPGAIYHIIVGALYLVGTILVTIVFNVPRKNALAAVDPASAEGATLWSRYLTEWMAWNPRANRRGTIGCGVAYGGALFDD